MVVFGYDGTPHEERWLWCRRRGRYVSPGECAGCEFYEPEEEDEA